MSTSTKPLALYTATVTPNGHQVSVLLEELKAAYPQGHSDYELKKINMGMGTQKEPWFLKLNPNGRIPVLIDYTRNDFPVFESSAILLYLAQHFDPEHKFWFDPATHPQEYSDMLQWIFFTHGGIDPMQGQSNYFRHVAPIPYARTLFLEETKRLYSVLEVRLTGRDYLAGEGRGKYSLADIKTFPWVRLSPFTGIETLDEWPGVKAWVERCEARDGAQAGINVGR